MINSMTAFSRREHSGSWGHLTWELRSVNHRYLEPAFKLPENLRHLEPALRERIKRGLARGKVECSLQFSAHAGIASMGAVNAELLAALLATCGQVCSQPGHWAALNPLEILAWPGILEDGGAGDDTVTSEALLLFDHALQELRATRQREGEQLARFIAQRLDDIPPLLDEQRSRMPALLAEQRNRIVQKLREVDAGTDPERLEQELVLLAQKSDVDEELDRLQVHLQEVRRVITAGGACGRRLDFLMQELNREANTLSAKSLSADNTLGAVALKVLIEQMREQIQNIE